MNENIEKVLAVLDGFRMSNEMTYSAYSVLYDEISLLDDLLKTQESSVPAVPLDKLCEYLNSVIYPCIICKEIPGPQCNAKRKGCWDRVLTKWMEEQDAKEET